MGTKLYVGNLPFSTTENELQELFSQAGAVQEVTLMQDKFTGKSRGFAFVTMGSEQDAQNAISQLNGKAMDGRPLTVNEARPRESRSKWRRRRRRSRLRWWRLVEVAVTAAVAVAIVGIDVALSQRRYNCLGGSVGGGSRSQRAIVNQSAKPLRLVPIKRGNGAGPLSGCILLGGVSVRFWQCRRRFLLP